MPPWHSDAPADRFSNDRRLTQAEIDTVVAWVDGGAKQGDRRDLPPAPQFVEGWAIGTPDLVLSIPSEFTLEADGPDEYQQFEIDPRFTEDKYVEVAEMRPGNRRIVHHINAFILPPDRTTGQAPKLTKEESDKLLAKRARNTIFYRDGLVQRVKADAPVYDDGCQTPSGGCGDRLDGSGEFPFPKWLSSFAPGAVALVCPPGTAKLVPAGSKILLQVHYSKTTGRVEKDRSKIGLIFARKPPQKELITRLVTNHYFRIPAGAENHRVTACWTTPEDIHLIDVAAHMHFRGKSMELKAIYPDSHSEVLLNVPKYDFSWQTIYYFKTPVAIPRGTKLMTTAYLDNSAANKYNPDASRAVRYGQPTYDEMVLNWIEYTVDGRDEFPADHGK